MNAEDIPGLTEALGQGPAWKIKLRVRKEKLQAWWRSARPTVLSEKGAAVILAAGFVIGRWTAPAPVDAGKELAGALRTRAASGAFEMLLPRGWEDLTGQAAFRSRGTRREVLLRQKSRSGLRLLAISKYVPGKSGPRNVDLLGAWIAGQRKEAQRLNQEAASFLPSAAAAAKGIPVQTFHLGSPPAQTAGLEASAGTFVFKGDFYEYAYATSHPGDEELLLALLGSVRTAKKK